MDNQNLTQTPPPTKEIQNAQKTFPFRSFLLANKYIIIFLSIVALISLSSSVYILASQNKTTLSTNNLPRQPVNNVATPTITIAEEKDSSANTNPSPPLQPTPTINPINGWQTYTSTAYGFTIKYPGDWLVKNTAQQDPKILEYVVFTPKSTTASAELTISLSHQTRTYQEALAIDPQVGEKITVASVSGTKKIQKDSNGNTTINVILPVNTKTIIFYAREKYQDIFYQMLSTFTFPK